jgi:hypothetical protein
VGACLPLLGRTENPPARACRQIGRPSRTESRLPSSSCPTVCSCGESPSSNGPDTRPVERSLRNSRWDRSAYRHTRLDCRTAADRSLGKNSTLRFHRTIARRAVKVAADNLKACGNAVYLYVPRILIRRRNLGWSGLLAMRALKVFNPTVAGHPLIRVQSRNVPYVVKAALRRNQKGPPQYVYEAVRHKL